MPLLLLRSLLLEMISDLPGPVSPGGEAAQETAPRYLVVVARNEPALYEHLRNRHGGDPRIRVVLDRRGANELEATPSAPSVERRRRRSWLTTGASHELVSLAREDTTESRSSRRQPSIRDKEAPRPMIEMETLEDTQRVTRWIGETQDLLGRVIPAMLEERDHLRHTLEAREHECERLRGELGEFRRNLAGLQSELDTLQGERVAVSEAFGGVVDLLGQLQRPLGEIARRLQGAPPVTVNTSAA
jgi:hypothetical protein